MDSSNSPEVARHYGEWLSAGIHIISPGTFANSDSFEYYKKLQSLTRSQQRHFLFESSVCGSLPVIETLADLLQTGDEVVRLEGILSGALSLIMGRIHEGIDFSDVLREALSHDLMDESITEDLNGHSVMRKSLILGRELGLQSELSDLRFEKLIEVASGSTHSEIIQKAKTMDALMRSKVNEAKEQNRCLQYVTTITPEQGIKIELKALPQDHVFSRITPGETIVAFYTKRLGKQPLVVQGPGAGTEVVSAAITADLLRLTRYLGSIG
jgi:aspartokinase/homoserine dehydrogenase 1